ncbi:MAG: c-type cytochrome [Rhodospirillaceae bacterium]
MRLIRTPFGAALWIALLMGGCGNARTAPSIGDAEHGKLLLRQYGCGACHRIPGVAVAHGNVGPSLERIAERVYLAGMLPNVPENMVRWIRAPRAIDPLTGMPDLRVPEPHARDMTAYLYTLR